MLLSEICIKRPVFAIVINLIILTLGLIFFNKLEVRGIPDIDPPIITVQALYPGADALYMEKEITTKIEENLKNVKYIDYITSTSQTGQSTIILSFTLKADIEIALNDVRSKISEISSIFPDDMKIPQVSKMDSDQHPSLWLAVTSNNYDEMALTSLIKDLIQDPLERLASVGATKIFGSKEYTIKIEPDFNKMYQYQISPLMIEDAVKKQNKNYPAGNLYTSTRDFTIRLQGDLTKPEEFENIILTSTNNRLLKLKEIAKVKFAPDDDKIIFRYNGIKAIALGIIKQSKANIIDLSKEVKNELDKIKTTLPKGVDVQFAHDGAVPVNASIKAVYHTIAEALILVVLVTYLFLASMRITLIPFVTIPVSLIATFSCMYFLGFSINTFTLLAMILAIGLVVDDAIVMLENIFRHHELGQAPMEAAKLAVREISFAIIAMTITLTTVFLPIGLIEGFIGKLFIEFAWTLAFCVLFSGFVSLTLTPMMASRMIRKKEAQLPSFLIKFNYYFNMIQSKYLFYLNLAFENKKKFFMLISGSTLLLVISLIFISKSFVPEEDDGFLQIVFTGPEGSSAKQSLKSVTLAEKALKSHADIQGFFEIVGWGGGESAFAFVTLKDWSKRTKSQTQIKDELNQKFAVIPAMSIFAMSPRSLASGNASKPIEFNLQTYLDYGELDKISGEFLDEMKQSNIFQNIERDLKSSTPTLDVIVNRDKAYLYGVGLDSIGLTMQYLIAGKQVGDFRMGNQIYKVILKYNDRDISEVSDIRKIFVKNIQDSLLPLETVADIIEKITVKSYSHYNKAKAVQISADLNPGYNVETAISTINKIADKLIDPSTTKLEYLGEIKRMQESNNSLGVTFFFALIFIYLVLSAQFESFFDPLLILIAVPFSITGGVLALLLTGDTLNMYSNIGLITLIGLITKNSIMIVEFANQLREQGRNIRDAVVEAASLRLRPIFMTSLATIFGAVPLVLASGAGAAARNSIGLVIVGGMILGTIFTIFVIPVLYQTFKRA